MSAVRRAHLAETARAQKARQRGEVVWTLERIKIIQRAFMAGGREAALEAFPEMRRPQIAAAIRRYCSGPIDAPTGLVANLAASRQAGTCWDDPDFNRRFFEALTGMTRLEYVRR
jgi:hypothetical protein